MSEAFTFKDTDKLNLLLKWCQSKTFEPETPVFSFERCKGAEAIFLFGVEIWHLGKKVRSQSNVPIIYLDIDLEKVKSFVEKNDLSHQKDYLVLPSQHLDLSSLLLNVSDHFATEKPYILVSKGSGYGQDLSESLLTLMTLKSMELAEVFHFETIFSNIVYNLKRLKQSSSPIHFKNAFQGIPAVICGAGPSMNELAKDLLKFRDKALFFAGGSSIGILNHKGIFPDFQFATDPTEKEYTIIKNSFSFTKPMFHELRTVKHLHYLVSSDHICCISNSLNPLEQFFYNELGLDVDYAQEIGSSGGSSVTMLCLDMAIWMGCNPIIFAGVDLCYQNDDKYAKGACIDQTIDIQSKQNNLSVFERLITKNDRKTQLRWALESDEISQKITHHKDRAFYQLSKKSMPIENIELVNSTIFESIHSFDLDGLIHTSLLSIPHFSESNINAATIKLEKGLDTIIDLYKGGPLSKTEQYFLENELIYSIIFQPFENILKKNILLGYSQERVEQTMLELAKKLQYVLGVL